MQPRSLQSEQVEAQANPGASTTQLARISNYASNTIQIIGGRELNRDVDYFNFHLENADHSILSSPSPSDPACESSASSQTPAPTSLESCTSPSSSHSYPPSRQARHPSPLRIIPSTWTFQVTSSHLKWGGSIIMFGSGITGAIVGFKSTSVPVTVCGIVSVMMSFILSIVTWWTERRRKDMSLDEESQTEPTPILFPPHNRTISLDSSRSVPICFLNEETIPLTLTRTPTTTLNSPTIYDAKGDINFHFYNHDAYACNNTNNNSQNQNQNPHHLQPDEEVSSSSSDGNGNGDADGRVGIRDRYRFRSRDRNRDRNRTHSGSGQDEEVRFQETDPS
ncbi:hypothetical protein GYMLUDRAFT_38393 [Collybiopsis luxurians FD-317 M1]|nr:hypothetical protein GYMLUDRAFT_38393 [Collybiopsis luxurians FD-317 M1]